MKGRKDEEQARHPIKVVSTRTGIPQDVLRAWERRYNAVTPQRTKTGRRLYTDLDVRRLALLRRVVAAGRRISDVAGLPLEALEALAREDRKEAADGRETVARRKGEPEAERFVQTAIDAVTQMDKAGLEDVLSEAALAMSAAKLRRDVLTPLLYEIGDRWRDGSARIIHEHLASAIVRTFVDGMRERQGAGSGPRLLLTTPPGHQHELGALMAAAAAEEAGWEAIYLGPSLPAEEIGAAARQLEARAVALSIVYTSDKRRLVDELRNIRRCLPADVAMIVGGRASADLRQAIENVEHTLVTDLGEFPSQLDALLSRTQSRSR